MASFWVTMAHAFCPADESADPGRQYSPAVWIRVKDRVRVWIRVRVSRPWQAVLARLLDKG